MSLPLDALLEQWGTALAQVLESMAEQKTAISSLAKPAPASEPELVWWEQPLQVAPDMTIWVAAPRAAWEHIGGVTLKAAGLETVEPVEARNTYIEILGQSLSALARSIGAMLGREVGCAAGEERAPTTMPEAGASVSMDFGGSVVSTVWIGFSPKLMAILSLPPERHPAGENADAKTQPSETDQPHSEPAVPATMDLLLEVELPVSISFGKAELAMKDVLKLTTGSIVELNRGVNEPVEVMVNNCLVARGEVVVVEGNYGVRIQHIASRTDRLRSLR